MMAPVESGWRLVMAPGTGISVVRVCEVRRSPVAVTVARVGEGSEIRVGGHAWCVHAASTSFVDRIAWIAVPAWSWMVWWFGCGYV